MAKKNGNASGEAHNGESQAPLQRAEARLQAVAAEFQQEKRRLDELGKKKEGFVRAVAEAKAQRESCAYRAYGHDDLEALKILADAQRRTREAEDELRDMDTAIATCEQRVADLEVNQQECQKAVSASAAFCDGQKAVSIAASLEPLTRQLVDLIVLLSNTVESARGHANNSLPENYAGLGPPPFWQIEAKVYLRYLNALLIEQGVALCDPDSAEFPDHNERTELVNAGSFQAYMAGLVNKGSRRLNLEAPDFERNAA